MRTMLLGLTVPLLLLTAGFAVVVPQAVAQSAATTYEVSGIVTSDAGDPLQGVRVSGYTSPESKSDGVAYDRSNYYGEAITDAEGRYLLKLAAGRGHINVYYDSWRQGDSREINVAGNLTDVGFTLKTPPPKNAIVSGTVLDPNGEPVANAQVQLSYFYGGGCCYRPMQSAVEPAQASAGENTSSAEASETTASPAPAPDSDARMSRPMIMPPYGYDDHQSAVTGADGKFSFKTYEGPRTVTAWAKGFAQTTMEVNAHENATTDVTVKLVKVPEKDAILTGRVVNSATGAPVAGAHVSIRSLEWGRWAETTTGKDGSYRIAALPGWTEMSVSVWNYGGQPIPIDAMASTADIAKPITMDQYFAYTLVLKLQSGDNTHDAKLDAKPKPTLALVGYVIDPDAKTGVEGARVNVWNQQTGDWGEAVTDATGSFKILVSPGHYSANAWKEGYLGGSHTFVVGEENVQRVDLKMPRGTPKYAPCYDDECGGPIIMYDTKAESAPMMADSAAPMGSPQAISARSAAAPTAPAPAMAGGMGSNNGAATFSGSGGGLPPYDPNAPAEAASSSGSSPAPTNGLSEVPGLGLLALLGIAGLAAISLRRKR